MQLRPIHGGETDPPGRNQDRKIKTGPRPIQDRRPDRTGPVSRGDPTDRKKIAKEKTEEKKSAIIIIIFPAENPKITQFDSTDGQAHIQS